MIKTKIIVFLLTISLFSCTSRENEIKVSGKIENGLRVIDIDTKDLNLTVYRGDYIVLNNIDNMLLKVPELEIETIIPIPKDKTPYIKIKESGVYNFSIGKYSGVLNVIELKKSNYKELTGEEALKTIKNINPIIIDVRTPEEYEAGHLINSSLLPVQILNENLDKLEQYKNEPILLYCASGNRSTVASKILIDNGFTKVYNLRYGYGDWSRKGLPVTK